jgi:EipB-like
MRNLSLAMVALATGASIFPASIQAFTLQPHSAVYEVRLIRASQSSRIEDARGVVRIDWRETCQSWTVSQRFQLVIAMADGNTSEALTEFRSVESKDGRRYSFESTTDRDGRQVENWKGEVERAGPDAPATALYSAPAAESLPLPGGTVFPMQQMAALLALAERGGGQVDMAYFDGPRPFDSPFLTHNVVSDKKRSLAEAVQGVTTAPFDRPWWPMRLAFYERGSQTPEPGFEIGAEILDNGIARLLQFDYGDFAIAATAVAGEVAERPRC